MRLALFGLSLALGGTAHAALLENVEARQEGAAVVIAYDVQSENPVRVTVRGAENGAELKLSALEGDVGARIAPGRGHRIRWNFLRDYPKGLWAKGVVFSVEAVEEPSAAQSKKSSPVMPSF